MSLYCLVVLADLLVVQLVGEKLCRVVVMIDYLVISVNVVCESSFLLQPKDTAPSLMSSTGV